MKLLIAGSRSIKEFNLRKYIPDGVDLIISGGACGIDREAENYADKYKISKLILHPDYKRYGKGAPLKRNEVMIDLTDNVLVVWDGESKGSEYTIRRAKEKGKKVYVIKVTNKDAVT